MNTKLIVGASILMLALVPTSALGYSDSRIVVLPGGFDEANTGGFSLAFCERVSDDVSDPSPSPVYCEQTGFSAIFADIGCSADFTPTATPILFGDGIPDIAPGCLDDVDGVTNGAVTGNNGTDSDAIDNFAEGSVEVTFTDGIPGAAFALVGNDRDDDGSIETGDDDGSADPDCSVQSSSTTSGEAGCHDDEFASGTTANLQNDPINVDFCFTRDREHADGDFDDFVVFLSADLNQQAVPDVGTAQVDLDATSYSAGCPVATVRSGHTDEGYHGTGLSDDNTGFATAGSITIAIDNGAVTIVDGTDMDCGVPIPPTATTTNGEFEVTCQANGSLQCLDGVVSAVGDAGSSGTITCGPSTATANAGGAPAAAGGDGAAMKCKANTSATGRVVVSCEFSL